MRKRFSSVARRGCARRILWRRGRCRGPFGNRSRFHCRQYAQSHGELTEQLIKSHTNDLFSIDEYSIRAPAQAMLFGGVQVPVAPDDKHGLVFDLSNAESCEEIGARGAVVQLVCPVDNLTVAVIESRPPFPRRFFPLLLEDALAGGILE